MGSQFVLGKQQRMELVISRFIREDREPRAMYDIGVGPKTEWRTLKTIYKRMRVFGCEPLLDLYPDLASFNGRIEPVAIAAQNGRAMIHYRPGKLISSSMFESAWRFKKREVETWTLDKFDHEMNRQKRILLWMDIEGKELEALQSGVNLLRSHRVRWINVEERREDGHHPKGWCHGSEIADFLRPFGFVRALEYNKHKDHQDVIYVSLHEGIPK
jgi:FkbM family methyltransferase